MFLGWRTMGLSLDPISGAAVMRVRWRAVLPLLLAAMFVTAFAGPASADNESYKVEQGLAVYLGVMPAGIVQGHPAGHPEATMHGGAPAGCTSITSSSRSSTPTPAVASRTPK